MVVQLKAVIYSKIKGLGGKLPKIRKAVFQDVSEYWVRELLPDHFKPSARTEFQHMPRDEEWKEAKRKFGRGAGRVTDLIFSGRSRRFLMEGPSIKATSTGATVRLDAPLYFRRPVPGQPDKSTEITNISGRHRNFMFRRMQDKTAISIQSVLRKEPLQKV